MSALNTTPLAADPLPDSPAPAPAFSDTTNPSVEARLADFPALEALAPGASVGSLQQLLEVSVNVTAELGRATLPISDILKLGPGSVVELDREVLVPVDLLVQGVRFARGEVVVIDGRFAIRVSEIIDPKQR